MPLDSTSFSAAVTSGTTIGWSHTIAGTTQLVLVVAVCWNTLTSITVTGITYGTQALTQVPSAASQDTSGIARTDLWFLLGPKGSKTITVTMSGTIIDAMAGAIVSSDALTVNTAGINNGTGTSASVTATSAAGEIVLAALTVNTAAAGGNTTTSGVEIWNQSIGTDSAAGSRSVGASPNVSSTWTTGNVGNLWAASSVSIKAAPGVLQTYTGAHRPKPYAPGSPR